MKNYKTFGAYLNSLPAYDGPLPASSITAAVCEDDLPHACTITAAELEHALEDGCYELVEGEEPGSGFCVQRVRSPSKYIKPAAVEPALQQAYFHSGGPGLALSQKDGQIVAVLD